MDNMSFNPSIDNNVQFKLNTPKMIATTTLGTLGMATCFVVSAGMLIPGVNLAMLATIAVVSGVVGLVFLGIAARDTYRVFSENEPKRTHLLSAERVNISPPPSPNTTPPGSPKRVKRAESPKNPAEASRDRYKVENPSFLTRIRDRFHPNPYGIDYGDDVDDDTSISENTSHANTNPAEPINFL